ncbi:MAG: hypothetical protein FJX89_08700 [Bacteroidetes bacterium]|nr:hypothetical protein [Bacteroidota bacterium]
MRLISFLFLVTLGYLSCGKDNLQSRPRLTLKEVSATTVPAQGRLQIILELTDKEGDFKDVIYVRKQTTRCPSSNFTDSQLYRIPGTVPRTANFKGEIVMSFTYPFELQPRCTRPDTAVFSFWLRDDKGNLSDTAKTPSIVILRP